MGIGFAPKTQRTGKGKEKNKSHYHTSSQLQQTQHAVEEDFDFFGVLTQYIGSTGTTRPVTDVNESNRHITKFKKIYLEKVTTIDRADYTLKPSSPGSRHLIDYRLIFFVINKDEPTFAKQWNKIFSGESTMKNSLAILCPVFEKTKL